MPDNPEWGYVPTVPQTGLTMTLEPGSGVSAQKLITPFGQSGVDQWVRSDLARAYSTAEVDQEARAAYLRVAEKAWATVTCRCYVDTKAVNLDAAEVAICKGTAGPDTDVKLTRLGHADAVSALQTGSGLVSVSLTGCKAGDQLWIVWWQKQGQQGTLAALRDAIVQIPYSALYQYKAATQPSGMAADTQFARLAVGEGQEPVAWLLGLA